MRDWCRVKGDMGNLPIFQDTDQSYDILVHVLKKYLTQDVIANCDNIDSLVSLAEILYNSQMKNRFSLRYFKRVIERIITLAQTEKSGKFLQRVISQNNDLQLELSLEEKIYASQKSQLIEKPLSDCFVAYCSERNHKKWLSILDFLFEKIVDSPLLFQMVVNCLKEFFVTTEYAQKAQNFIQIVLERIQTLCDKNKKNVLDLYPTSVQSCVILLRIEPSCHTEKSKSHTVQALKQVFMRDHNAALILVSHFPEWLPQYLEFFEILEESTQNSKVQSLGGLTQNSEAQSVIEIN